MCKIEQLKCTRGCLIGVHPFFVKCGGEAPTWTREGESCGGRESVAYRWLSHLLGEYVDYGDIQYRNGFLSGKITIKKVCALEWQWNCVCSRCSIHTNWMRKKDASKNIFAEKKEKYFFASLLQPCLYASTVFELKLFR